MGRTRRDDKHFSITGKQPVKEALSGNWPVREIVVSRGAHSEPSHDISRQATSLGIPVTMVEGRVFDRQYGRSAQGVAAVIAKVAMLSPEEALEKVPEGASPFFVALDGILDPHNLGAISRTALALGVHGVVVPRRRTAPVGEGAVKASAGAVFRQPICEVPNMNHFIEWSKKKGFWVFGLDASAEETIWTADLTGPLVLIVGGEGKGLSRLTRDRCDVLVRIPMSGAIGSLNASVACGIAVSEVIRRRFAASKEQRSGPSSGRY